MAKYYPINLNIEGKKCVVIGGGKVAERKVNTLLKFGGKILLISPEINEGLKNLIKNGKITYIKKKYSFNLIEDAFLVFAATSDREVNHGISCYAKELKILANVADSAKDSSFILPSIFKKKNLIISVSTSGKSPKQAKAIRDVIAKNFMKLLGEIR